MNIAIIPIGYNCTISFILSDDLHINYQRSPFEWNTSENLEKIIQLFKNNFKNFVSESIIPDGDFKIECAYNNPEYNIVFNHDMSQHNGLLYFDKAKLLEKYARRIKRIYGNINTADIVIIVRTSPNVGRDNKKTTFNLVYGNPNPTDLNAKELMNEFKKIYPNKNIITYYIDTEESYNMFCSDMKKYIGDNNYKFICGE